MRNIHNDEVEIMGAIHEFAQIYQTYQENFDDPKLEEIRNCVVIPIAQIGQNLLNVFDEMEQHIRSLKEQGIIDED